MSIFIVIAAYNEEKKIGSVLKEIRKSYRNIIVVDDGSKDKTYDVAKSFRVYVLKHVINRGQGAALKTGIDFALERNADIIVTFDADGQFLVKEIRDVIKPIIRKEADITVGSRFLGQAKNIPVLKEIVLKLGVLVVFFLYKIRITDSQCGFRALSRKAAEKINIKADRMEHASEFFSEIIRNKLKYKEIPITVIYDDYSMRKGQSWVNSFGLGMKMLFNRFLR